MYTEEKNKFMLGLPAFFVVIAALYYRWLYVGSVEKIGFDFKSGVLFVMLGASAFILLMSDRNPLDKALKGWVLVAVWFTLYGSYWDIAKYLMGGFICVGVSEVLLSERVVVSARNEFVDRYQKDYVLCGAILLALTMRNLLIKFGGPDAIWYACVLSGILIAMAGIFVGFGNDKWNTRFQLFILALCLFTLPSARTTEIMGYWAMLNLSMKFNEYLNKWGGEFKSILAVQ